MADLPTHAVGDVEEQSPRAAKYHQPKEQAAEIAA
jgi:hypothetical protein